MKNFRWSLLLALLPLATAVAEERSAAEALVSIEEPTGWSCTVATLISGEDCAFESAPNDKATAAENARRAAALRDRICEQAARVGHEIRPDSTLLQICRRDFAEAASHCDVTSGPILDAEGRFTTWGRDCYRGLSAVVRDVATMASTSAACCRCLQKNRCASSAETCIRTLHRGTPEAAAARCLDDLCASVCPLRTETPTPDPDLQLPPDPNADQAVPPRSPSRHVHPQLL